eukprot:264999-Alexandrium_andersonii.AAC.1
MVDARKAGLGRGRGKAAARRQRAAASGRSKLNASPQPASVPAAVAGAGASTGGGSPGTGGRLPKVIQRASAADSLLERGKSLLVEKSEAFSAEKLWEQKIKGRTVTKTVDVINEMSSKLSAVDQPEPQEVANNLFSLG